MWCLENEENLEGNITGTRILETLVNLTHRLDPTRPTTAAMNHGWNEGGYSDVVDVVGYNYGQRGMQYVKDKEKYPNRKMLATESTSYVATRVNIKIIRRRDTCRILVKGLVGDYNQVRTGSILWIILI